MASEFDRTRCDVGDRTVTITSWFDADKNHWSASAPNYRQYLQDEKCSGYESREAAIQGVIDLLRRTFG